MVQTRLHKHSLSKAEQAVSNVASRASVRDPINEFQDVYGSRAGSAAFRQQLGSDFSSSPQIQPPIQAKPSFRGLSQKLAAESQPVQLQEKENKTGLPDDLKAGVEALSGFSMDDVRVHYNSSKPAQLQALAYTQGTEIHVGPGQEKHLPHEAWHVVQQMQGRVQPTVQMKGVQINDDEGLEREADVMGKMTGYNQSLKKVTHGRQQGRNLSQTSPSNFVQRKLIIDNTEITKDKINKNSAYKTRLNTAISEAARSYNLEPHQVKSLLTSWAGDQDSHNFASKSEAVQSAAHELQTSSTSVEDHIPNISSDEFNVLKILDSGSTKPQLVELKSTKQKKVIKFGKDKGHLQTEILANKLYQAANIPVLKVDIVKVDGKLAQMTDYVENVQTPDEAELVNSEDFLRHIGADMLFANWDLFKTDNWMKIDGQMIRADNGGALDRSAQGHKKAKEDWSGSEVKDFASMKDKSNSPYHKVTNHEIADSVRTLARNLTPEKIDQAFEEAQYPLHLRAEMKQILLERINTGLKWVNKVYPLDKVIRVDHSWDIEMTREPEDDEPINHALKLIQAGFKNVPINATPEDLGELLRRGIIEPPDPIGKTGNPHESIPMVGPEELTREDQFGGGLAYQMPKFFARMKAGRLVRRMSDGERAAFETAAAEKNINTIVNLIFPEAGKPGSRGEMVWSVNKPFIFEREIAALKGEKYTGEEKAHKPEDYHWIMEIYITDEMLQFLQDFAYINNPTGGAKPSAFMGNPTLKMEGQAGGVRGKDGIPNVVIKKDGFAKFWGSIQEFHFVEAEDHLWKNASDNEELLKAKKEAERQKIQEEVSKRRSEQREEKTDEDVQLSYLFGSEESSEQLKVSEKEKEVSEYAVDGRIGLADLKKLSLNERLTSLAIWVGDEKDVRATKKFIEENEWIRKYLSPKDFEEATDIRP